MSKEEIEEMLFNQYNEAYKSVKAGDYLPRWFEPNQLAWIHNVFKQLQSNQSGWSDEELKNHCIAFSAFERSGVWKTDPDVQKSNTLEEVNDSIFKAYLKSLTN